MAQTQIPFGSPLARKVFGAAVFSETCRRPTFMNRLTGPAPTISSETAKMERMVTDPNYPCMRITDLAKSRGDTVSVDMFNILTGKPVVGDKNLSGKMMSLKASSQDIRIDQIRGGVDPGGRMTQQRTVHDLRAAARSNMVGWWNRFLDQWRFVALGGDRGSMITQDWVIPLASDPDFLDIMVNAPSCPTYNRQFYANNAASLDALDTTDVISLSDIDRLRALIDDSDIPLQPIILPDDPGGMDDNLYVLIISSRQWRDLQTATGPTAWRTFVSNARERASSNPLFTGEIGMWNGILVKKTSRAIRFNPGDVVNVATSAATYTTTTKTVPALTGYTVDRALLLGAQAMAEVWGKDSDSGTHMRWWEEVTDHGNRYESSVSGMGGMAKLRVKDINGVDTDHGVFALDTVTKGP